MPLNEALACCARVSDPALDPTEGLPEHGISPMHGDLRSSCRRGQETRAERAGCARVSDPALHPTEGLPEHGVSPMHGDLRSSCRRGQETRAERFIKRYWL